MPVPLRFARLYLSENKPAIIAAMHFNSAGICYEQEDPFVDKSGDWDTLVASLRSALARFSLRDKNLRDHKKTDWPAFRGSGCRSVRQFEDLYLQIEVRAVNEAEFYYASCQPRGEKDITLQVTLNRYGKDDEIDGLLRKLFKASLRWAADSDPD